MLVSTPGAIALAARWGWVECTEEPAGQCDVGGPVGIGEETIVADAVEPVGQDIDQKAANELVSTERHQLVTSGVLVTSCRARLLGWAKAGAGIRVQRSRR